MTERAGGRLRSLLHTAALACLGACETYSDPILAPKVNGTASYLCSGEMLSASDSERYGALLGSAFTWVTGSVQTASAIPAIDVAPYCAVDAFLPEVRLSDLGLEMLEVLTPAQRAQLTLLRDRQRSEWQAYVVARDSIVARLFGLKQGERLDEAALLTDADSFGKHQGEIANEQLAAFATLLNDLTPAQVQHLAQVAQGKVMPLDVHDSTLDVAAELDALSVEERAQQWSLAAKAFAWSQSPLADNQKLTVRKVASFFGFGFYRFAAADAELSNRDQREELIAQVFGALEPPQRDVLCDLLETERDVYEEYVASRAQLLAQTQAFLDGSRVDSAKVVSRSEELGRIEGHLAIRRAKAFNQLEGMLTNAQRTELQILRQTTETVPEL